VKQDFDLLYADGNDPWAVTTSWYERRKYALTLAVLPRERYRHGLELGCGFGVMSGLLHERCDQLTAIDGSTTAVARARGLFAGTEGMCFEEAVLPHEMPPVTVDLVVVSELLYYLSRADLDELLDRLVVALEPGGDLVAVHLLSRNPLSYDGAEVHPRLRARPELEHVVTHEDEGFILDVLRRS
jgi:trans-aconitate methyltransferase